MNINTSFYSPDFLYVLPAINIPAITEIAPAIVIGSYTVVYTITVNKMTATTNAMKRLDLNIFLFKYFIQGKFD